MAGSCTSGRVVAVRANRNEGDAHRRGQRDGEHEPDGADQSAHDLLTEGFAGQDGVQRAAGEVDEQQDGSAAPA
jgi:hypothetical protein